MNETLVAARRMIDALDEFFADRKISQRDHAAVWDILSALRGPDLSAAPMLKLRTTAVLRALTFPRYFADAEDSLLVWGVKYMPGGSGVLHEGTFAGVREEANDPDAFPDGGHFLGHLSTAVSALIAIGRDDT